jgi:hypothetical protein
LQICKYHPSLRRILSWCRSKLLEVFWRSHTVSFLRAPRTVQLIHPTRYTEDDSTAKPAETVTESNAQPAVVESKVEQPIEETEHNGDGDGDQQMYNGEQDMDDEIDFNLGNGNGGGNGNHDNGYDATSNNHEAHGPGIKEDG